MCDISRATPNVHDVFILIKQANCVQQLLWRHLLINRIMYIKKTQGSNFTSLSSLNAAFCHF